MAIQEFVADTETCPVCGSGNICRFIASASDSDHNEIVSINELTRKCLGKIHRND